MIGPMPRRTLCATGFDDLGLDRVIAQTLAVNAGSRAVMERVQVVDAVLVGVHHVGAILKRGRPRRIRSGEPSVEDRVTAVVLCARQREAGKDDDQRERRRGAEPGVGPVETCRRGRCDRCVVGDLGARAAGAGTVVRPNRG